MDFSVWVDFSTSDQDHYGHIKRYDSGMFNAV